MDNNQNRKVNIIEDLEGNKTVIIHDTIFKGRRSIKWKEVRIYLKQYVGEIYQIDETNDIVNIASDFPVEYSGSNYTVKLKGGVAKAKANAAQGIPELIKIAENKRFNENRNSKHNIDATEGWYYFDTRFGFPICDDDGNIERYNIYRAMLIVRCNSEGKKYIYDIERIKKEKAPCTLGTS